MMCPVAYQTPLRRRSGTFSLLQLRMLAQSGPHSRHSTPYPQTEETRTDEDSICVSDTHWYMGKLMPTYIDMVACLKLAAP
jgi:hypothetical protein